MEVSKLYRIDKPNTGQTPGFLFKGVTNVTVLGSQSKPAAVADMVDIGDGAIIEEGAYGYVSLPEYIYLDGAVADGIEIVNASVAKDLGAL